MLKLSPSLLPVLRLKVQGYPTKAIADELGHSPSTIDTYAKRIIQFLKDEGWWDARYSSKTGLSVCGRQYLESLESFPSKPDSAGIVPNDLLSVTVHNGADTTRRWAALSPEQIEVSLRQSSYDPYEAASQAISLGNRFYRDWLCTEAIPIFRIAENFVGAVASQAARAACSTAQMYLELGDLYTAKEKITQAQHIYESLAGSELQIYMQHINGWIDYNQGNLDQAEEWYHASLLLAAPPGMEHLGQHAHHFLGRIYTSRGQLSTQKQQAAVWFYKAEDHLDTAYQLHLTWGDDGDRGYDLLRMAQLRRAQRRWREARHLREQARHLFGTGLYYLDIDLEEAGILFKDNHEKEARRKAETALEVWADVKRTKAIADALQLLGQLKHKYGKGDQAIDYYLASLCLYPFEQFPGKQRLLSDCATLIRQEPGRTPQQHVEHLQERIQEYRGQFGYLKRITIDRSSDIARIMSTLRSLVYQS